VETRLRSNGFRVSVEDPVISKIIVWY